MTPSNPCDYKGFSVSVSDELQTWEEVTEEDTKRTLWLPDYAVSNCHDCGVQFWFITRRHHCRFVTNFYSAVLIWLVIKRTKCDELLLWL